MILPESRVRERMDRMKRRKRGFQAVLLVLVLVLGAIPIVPAKEAEAAKKMKLSKKKLSLKVGKTKKLSVKNKKKKAKVTWLSSKKKVATVSKKGVVRAKKAGKATITAKVKYKKTIKKLKCKVTVTKAKKKQPTKKPDVKSTVKPTAQATAGPTGQPTAKPTPISQVPEPAKAKEWDTEKMGSFSVSGIHFEDSSLTYQLGRNAVYLNIGSKYFDVKEAVPDLTKCIFEVYAGEKRYNDVVVGDIKWNNKSYSDEELEIYTDGGYYEFKLYINVDPKFAHLNFIDNKGIALAREKILNNVWNYDYFGDARTIDTHVKKLRKKMGESGDLIKTIWGMGYKFEVSL